MPNPTTGFESQFTPSFNWGNGFSSFDIATQQETLIIGTNPTNTANRTRKILEYDFFRLYLSSNVDESKEIERLRVENALLREVNMLLKKKSKKQSLH